MLKPFNKYTLEIWATVSSGIAAQILCFQDTAFIGRIDFYTNEALPSSYLWHPNGTYDPNQIYIVLAMPIDRFDGVEEILRTERSFGLELWPIGEMFGAYTDGYGGVLRSLEEELVGGGRRLFCITPKVKAAEVRGAKVPQQ
jgi:hypothetical protein